MIVAIEQLKTHRIYGKRMRQTHRIQACPVSLLARIPPHCVNSKLYIRCRLACRCPCGCVACQPDHTPTRQQLRVRIQLLEVMKGDCAQAHNPDGKAGLGDLIEIDACRPYSKTKRFMVGKIVKAFELIVDEETGEVAALGDAPNDDDRSCGDIAARLRRRFCAVCTNMLALTLIAPVVRDVAHKHPVDHRQATSRRRCRRMMRQHSRRSSP